MKHIVRTTLIGGSTAERTVYASGLASAMDKITWGDVWGVFYQHPRKPIWVRRSKCNQYQQTIEQNR